MRTLVFTGQPKAWEGFTVRGDQADVVYASVVRVANYSGGDSLLFCPAAAAFRDYDLFVIANLGDENHEPDFSDPLPIIDERLQQGGRLIFFADPPLPHGIRWPAAPREVEISGKAVLVNEDDPFGRSLAKLGGRLSYSIEWPAEVEGAFAKNKLGWAVGQNTGTTLILPAIDGNRPRILEQLLRENPDFLPTRFVTDCWTPKRPAWLSTLSWPRLLAATQDLEQSQVQLEKATASVAARQRALDDERKWADLLWAKGKDHLEPIIRAALNELRVPVHEEPPIDAVHRADGLTLLIEIEGSKNLIGVNKGRQLSHYLADHPDPDAKGAIIGNPFCETDLVARVTVGFGPELRKMADKNGWALVTTKQLFDLVIRTDDARFHQCRQLLGLE